MNSGHVPAPLAPGQEGAELTAQQKAELVRRGERFRAELPQMLKEHKRISAALKELHNTAHAEGNQQVARLAVRILEHAATEEQVLYPAALLVSDFIGATGPDRR